jgi:CRISPR-associated protein Csm2
MEQGKMDREERSRLVLENFPALDQLKGKDLDKRARAAGETFASDDRIKTHQLRNIFSAIERLRTRYQQDAKAGEDARSQVDFIDELFLLKPKLAYAAGRQRAIRYHLFPFMENAIDAVDQAGEGGRDKAIRNFFALMESVVGYHKYFENK